MFAVAYHNGVFPVIYSQGFKRIIDHLRFSAAGVVKIRACNKRKIAVQPKMLQNGFCKRLRLGGGYDQRFFLRLQLVQQLGNPGVDLVFVYSARFKIFPVVFNCLFCILLRKPEDFGKRGDQRRAEAFAQPLLARLFDFEFTQRIFDGVGDSGRRVRQCSVQIKRIYLNIVISCRI